MAEHLVLSSLMTAETKDGSYTQSPFDIVIIRWDHEGALLDRNLHTFRRMLDEPDEDIDEVRG